MRSIHIVVLGAAASIAVATTFSGHADALSSRPQVELADTLPLQLAARKGTRLYTGDGSTAESRVVREKASDTLEACMATWSRDTHISKSKWREICERQLQE